MKKQEALVNSYKTQYRDFIKKPTTPGEDGLRYTWDELSIYDPEIMDAIHTTIGTTFDRKEMVKLRTQHRWAVFLLLDFLLLRQESLPSEMSDEEAAAVQATIDDVRTNGV